jgi:GAF domain-containing protein
MGDEVYEVNNALKTRFLLIIQLTGNPDIRFYAGAPLQDANGFNLGSLCVIDTKPSTLKKNRKPL